MTPTPHPECAAILSEISAYLDGELAATRCSEIEAHCATCPECAELVQGLQKTIGLCQGVAAEPIPAHVRERAQQSIRQLLGR